ncbi:MAG: hypothetical protein J5787_01450 [Alphaproteobacteria bacterium]|nr:hypothetical protein [Alphaproteobacteria bacterium]MBO4644415.1 hypothetical protein [Alphaproteobacteria bacterium]
MDINELPSPQFLINEAGMISVFLPAFEGEPDNPVLTKKDEKTLHFQRSANGDILLTEIDEAVMQALAETKKILVIETNVLKSIDVLDKALSAYIKSEQPNPDETQDEIMDTIERAYEIEVRV